jgi:hypothetical protein
VVLSSCHLCSTLNLEMASRFWKIFVPLLVGMYQCFRGPAASFDRVLEGVYSDDGDRW